MHLNDTYPSSTPQEPSKNPKNLRRMLGRPQFYSQAFYHSASACRGFGPLERGSFMGANIENSNAAHPFYLI